jgi:propionyl-CoA synthetase
VRVLKKQDPAALTKHDLSSLRAPVPGRRAARRAHRQVDRRGLGKPIIDNYWQTETGWPILTICNGVEKAPSKFGSPARRCTATT